MGTTASWRTIEPWRSNQVVVYRLVDGTWARRVIDEAIVDGHTLLTGDFDDDGRDEILAGERQGHRSIDVYGVNPAGHTCARQTLDDGHMAGSGRSPMSAHRTVIGRPVPFVDGLGGPLNADELETIASVARGEITQAFAGLRVTVSERRNARYRVRVLQQLRDPRFRGEVEVAGTSRAVSMFGGDGAVNFSFRSLRRELRARRRRSCHDCHSYRAGCRPSSRPRVRPPTPRDCGI